MRELRITLAVLPAVMAVRHNPVRSADDKTFHDCSPEFRSSLSYRLLNLVSRSLVVTSAGVNKVRVCVKRSVTLWITPRNPLLAFTDFLRPVPDTTNFGT